MEKIKFIELTQGQYAIVDEEDFEYLNQWSWNAHKDARRYYARRSGSRKDAGKRKVIQMHRELIHAKKGLLVDHINRDSLDNRKNNLRMCTHSQNRFNSDKHKPTTSRYYGVCWYKPRKKWLAQIQSNKKHQNIGYFSCEDEAAIAYNKKAIELHGEFARLNQVTP